VKLLPVRTTLALGVAAIAALAAGAPAPITPPASAAVGDCTPGATWPAARDDLATQVVNLVNDHRAGMGLGRLSTSASLTRAAVWKARHMAMYRYMTHDDPAPPVARTTGDRLAACGYPVGAAGWGENIAYGYPSASAVVTGWLNSPGHRQNIETAAFRSTGVGAAATSTGVIYWAQTFGTATDATLPPPPTGTAPTVRLTAYPASTTTLARATFSWTTTGSPTSATCSLDGAAPTPCTSPREYRRLKRTAHTFRVTVANAAGSASASYAWKRVA
jgi:uncharacterized protein YkwD